MDNVRCDGISKWDGHTRSDSQLSCTLTGMRDRET